MHRPVDLAQRRAAQPNAHFWKVRGPGTIEKGISSASHASGISFPYASRVMLSGSGRRALLCRARRSPRSDRGRAQSRKTSKFSAIRAGLVDFGIAERLSCTCHRSITCAGRWPSESHCDGGAQHDNAPAGHAPDGQRPGIQRPTARHVTVSSRD
jgi:hypothetical protein